jgi:general secretion pathway protein G
MPRYKLRTLLMLLAVVPPFIAWLSIPYIRGRFSKQGVTKLRLSVLHDAVLLYQLEARGPPASLGHLMVDPAQIADPAKWGGPNPDRPLPLDAWGQPFGYEIIDAANGKYRLWSNGPDTKPGTSDDIAIGF